MRSICPRTSQIFYRRDIFSIPTSPNSPTSLSGLRSLYEAEPAIRQLLKIDFEEKVRDTVMRSFRQVINQSLNNQLLPIANLQAEQILEQYDRARAYLAKALEKEAEEKIRQNQRQLAEVEQCIGVFNEAVDGINSCLEAMQLDRHRLPTLS